MKSVKDQLKTDINHLLLSSKLTWNKCDVEVENTFEDLRQILECLNKNSIKFKSENGCSNNTVSSKTTTCEELQKDGPKRRGRATKTSTMLSDVRVVKSDKSDTDTNDDTTSTSSKSRRAAAQAAEQKLAQVQSLVQLNTKLRRPTNFDEKQVKAVSSPPTKCRRTQRNQSAGSSSSQTEEVIGETCKNENVSLESDSNTHLNSRCLVFIEKLDTPTIESHTQPRTRSSRSLERRSEDLFSDSNNMRNKSNAPNSDPQQKPYKNKTISKECLNRGISCAENELWLMKENVPIAQSSPIPGDLLKEEFKGFDEQLDLNKKPLDKNSTFSVMKTKETQIIEGGENTEVRGLNNGKSSSKTQRNRDTYQIINSEEKENVNRNNETFINDTKTDLPPSLRSQSKVFKKPIDHNKNTNGKNETTDEDTESLSSPEYKPSSRTKTIKKHNKQTADSKYDNEISEQKARSRTKTLRKKNEKEDHCDSDSKSTRSRTKTLKKESSNVENNEVDQDYLISEFKDNPTSNKSNKICPLSPAPAKGELVKKRVEDFEKMQNGTEDSEEEKNVGRVTRNTIKSKTVVSVAEAQTSKHTRNIALSKLQACSTNPPTSVKSRMTPLGANNRLTPGLDSAQKSQLNKATGSSGRPIVESSSVTLIQKEAVEDTERKRKEEEHLRRQAKEEEAKRKKEKALKATAEETRRKRIEKLQKVAATREAAEKEKERLAAKAEKEKEEKMRQIAIEKERLKKEQLKKKQLQQQKTLELEERRKQEEAARLAKLKEQEEEHKRQQAMRERELELQNQQKAELRLAEAEKMKLQGGKLGKIAAINNANSKLQHGTTPSDKKNCPQIASNCYEVTPGREDRPLLPPKTEDDYGIDDAHSGDSTDDESQPRKMIPLWAQAKERERLLVVNKYIPKKLWDLFMECDPCPDINNMFAGNPFKKRIRTSSAVWQTPPKFSRFAP